MQLQDVLYFLIWAGLFFIHDPVRLRRAYVLASKVSQKRQPFSELLSSEGLRMEWRVA